MDETFLRSCSYSELRRIAVEHDILQTVKSKKKIVLMEKLIEFFSQTSAEMTSLSNEDNLESPKKPLQTKRGRKNKMQGSIEDLETQQDLPDISENLDRKETLEPLKIANKKKRGRKNISEESIDQIMADKSKIHSELQVSVEMTLSSNEDNLESPKKPPQAKRGRKNKKQVIIEDLETQQDLPASTEMTSSPNEDNVESPKKPLQTKRGRKNKRQGSIEDFETKQDLPVSAEMTSSSNEHNLESPKKPQTKRGRKNKMQGYTKILETQQDLTDRRETFVVPVTKDDDSDQNSNPSQNHSKSPQKLPTMKRGRRNKSKKVTSDALLETEKMDSLVSETTVNSDRRETFTVTDFENNDLPQMDSVSSDSSTGSFKQKMLRNKNKKVAVNETALNETFIKLPEGPISDYDRRGTFSVIKSEKVLADKDPLFCDGILTRSDERKRKRCNSERDQTVPEKTADLIFSSPRTAPKQVKIVAAPTPLNFVKTVNFMTPKNGKRSTPKRSNISLTPHPSKKSVSTPYSSKKQSGHFSAKKMPNFAKIHQSNFEKMESLLKYTERKAARRELICSPLNKTFSSLSSTGKVQKHNSSTGRKPAKSLIPVKSRSARLNEKENLSSLIMKIPSTTVNSIREKERDIIKGVRANKRFMLQMKMRNLAC